MKNRLMILSFLICAAVLFISYECSWANSKVDKRSPVIGVVSIRKIFRDCKKNVVYRQESKAEQDRIVAELEKLSKEFEALNAGLKTLKPESSDYLELTREVLQKQGGLQAQQEFYKQQLALKDKSWTEALYRDILRRTKEVAEQKGLNLVFEKGEIELPAVSTNELMLTIRTHKLLYSEGCPDITDEVMARVDAGK